MAGLNFVTVRSMVHDLLKRPSKHKASSSLWEGGSSSLLQRGRAIWHGCFLLSPLWCLERT